MFICFSELAGEFGLFERVEIERNRTWSQQDQIIYLYQTLYNLYICKFFITKLIEYRIIFTNFNVIFVSFFKKIKSNNEFFIFYFLL